MIFDELKKQLPGVKKNVPLKNHTTFQIGGPAEYFYIAKQKEDVIKAIAVAKNLKLPLFIFGGGSNLLVSDMGIGGLTVRMQSNIKTFTVKGSRVQAYAGASLGAVVNFSIRNSLKGLEWAGGLPGTFGGAIRGNAGCFGSEMKDIVVAAAALDDQFKLRNFTYGACKFSYRNSVFKEKGWTIVSATVQLKKGNKKELRAMADSHVAYRKEKHPLEYGSAGSVFKNVDVKDIAPEFLPLFEDKIKQDPFPIVPAAWFIIGAGLTGKKIGRAQISKKHSNYIVNLGPDASEAGLAGSPVSGARAKDVLTLMEIVKKEVKAKYGISLEPEVQYVGE